MSSTHPIGVVTGITGAQGRSIAHRLIKAGYQVRGLTRSSAQNNHIQSMGATPVIVDFSDLTRLVYAFDHADVVAFTSPIDHRAGVRERLADQIAKAAEQARVRRIVFNSAAEIVDDYDRPVAQVLKAIRDRLQASSVPVMTLQPTVYMDNLAAPWAAPTITQEGVFAYPIQVNWPISWISHRTLADFVVAAARYETNKNRIFRIGGPEALTADTMATILSETLGRPVRHVSLALDDFAHGLNAAYGAPTGDDIADFYCYLEMHPQALVRDGSAATELGVMPESFQNWAARQQWPV